MSKSKRNKQRPAARARQGESAGPVERQADHAEHSTGVPSVALRLWACCASVALVAYVLYGFNTFLPALVAPIVAALVGGHLATGDWKQTSLAVSAGQTLGFWAANAMFSHEHVLAALDASAQHTQADLIFPMVYGSLVLQIIEARSVDSAAVAVWLVGVAITAGVAVLLERSKLLDAERTTISRAPFFIGLMLIGVAFIVTLYGSTGEYRQWIRSELPAGQYAADQHIYAKVNWLLDRGVPYYQALVEAAAGDTRLIEAESVKAGKFVGWASSPSMVRQPWSFRFTQMAGGPSGVFGLSAACAVLALLGFAAAIGSRSLPAGLTAGAALYPLMVMGAGWHNIMLPDWWASLAVIGSAAALVTRPPAMRYLAIALAIAAVMFRETAAIWLVVLLGVLVWDWYRRRERAQVIAVWTGVLATGAFALSYGAHIRSARAIIDSTATRSLIDVFGSQAAGSIETRFLAPTSYLMFPYGQFAVPGFVLVMLGAAAFVWWGISRSDLTILACGLYVVIWIAYLLVVGTFSAYWGLLFLGLGVAGIGYWTAFGDVRAARTR